MFNVETKKYGEVRVSFRHINPTNEKGVPVDFDPTGLLKGTTCYITTNEEDAATIAQGRTILSLRDQYDKDRGRKLSLARAMKDAGLDRDQRILFWRQYFATQGKDIVI